MVGGSRGKRIREESIQQGIVEEYREEKEQMEKIQPKLTKFCPELREDYENEFKRRNIDYDEG